MSLYQGEDPLGTPAAQAAARDSLADSIERGWAELLTFVRLPKVGATSAAVPPLNTPFSASVLELSRSTAALAALELHVALDRVSYDHAHWAARLTTQAAAAMAWALPAPAVLDTLARADARLASRSPAPLIIAILTTLTQRPS